MFSIYKLLIFLCAQINQKMISFIDASRDEKRLYLHHNLYLIYASQNEDTMNEIKNSVNIFIHVKN